MAIKSKGGRAVVKGGLNLNVTKEEAAFMVAKLRQAQYTGEEFDLYYHILQKLIKIIK